MDRAAYAHALLEDLGRDLDGCVDDLMPPVPDRLVTPQAPPAGCVPAGTMPKPAAHRVDRRLELIGAGLVAAKAAADDRVALLDQRPFRLVGHELGDDPPQVEATPTETVQAPTPS